jgi:F-type H+-transporting ATPase subunit delta
VTAAHSKVDAYARAILAIARAEDRVAPVEDDLFRFARALEGSEPLRVALTDPQLPLERRVAVVDELTSGKALALSSALLGMVIGAGQVNDLGAIVDRFVELAAASREREVAEVRSAIELDDAQVAVEVKVIIDPSVLGGLVARIGDTVIDGSVRHRLDQMKAQL